MIIQNYGLHWKRAAIHWGVQGPGGGGDLMGRPSMRVGGTHVDFRHQAGIYVLHAGFDPIYIGQAGRAEGSKLFARLRNHTRNHMAERWDRFSWFGIYPVREDGTLNTNVAVKQIRTNVEDVLDHVEGVLISIAEPKLNRQGARFGSATQYKQIPLEEPEDDEGAPTEED